MTFYTPTMYPYGVPGSHHVVEVVTKDLPSELNCRNEGKGVRVEEVFSL